MLAGSVALTGAFSTGCAETEDTVGAPGKTKEPPLPSKTAVFDAKAIHAALSSDGSGLTVTVPLTNPSDLAVSGTVTLEVTDLDGKTYGKKSTPFQFSEKEKALVFDFAGLPAGTTKADLVKFVLAYHVPSSKGEAGGKRSVYDAIAKLDVLVMAETQLITGQAAGFTLFALDPATAAPVKNAAVKVRFQPVDAEGKDVGTPIEVEAKTDDMGRASGDVILPKDFEGAGKLTVVATGNEAVETSSIDVKVTREQKILVTTDKPMYQPGQIVHLRALALASKSKTPVGKTDMLLEIEDAKGNKIAKELVQTDEFGIAAKDIQLATQINLGNWKIRATLGETKSEKTVSVSRYVLPKFKVEAGLDKAWYRPGDKVKIAGQSRYFFGKAVASGKVHVKASTFDVEFTPFAEIDTTTQADGTYSVEVKLPDHLVGTALAQGKGMMQVEVSVTDGAQHVETTKKAATLAQGGLDAMLVPESGDLVPGVDNTVYVITSDPIGQPVEASVAIADEDGKPLGTVSTNASGLGSFGLIAGKADPKLKLTVTPKAPGESIVLERTLSAGKADESILLRTAESVYKAGDTLELTVLVPSIGETNDHFKDTVYLDLVQNGRTVDMQSLPVTNGKAAAQIDIDATLEGELILSAFRVSRLGTIVRDQKLVYVQPSNALNVSITPGKAEYAPGEKATLALEVKDKDGKGVAAAVGLNIVDEAVFALQDLQPGLLKTFFDLTKELLTPRYQILTPGMSAEAAITAPPEVLEDAAKKGEYQAAAKVAFASVNDAPVHGFEQSTYKAQVAKVMALLKPFADKERLEILKEFQSLANAGAITLENAAAYLQSGRFERTDFWGQAYKATYDETLQQAVFTSAGPDARVGTYDDLVLKASTWELMYRNYGWGGEGDMDGGFNGGPQAAGGAGGGTGGGPMPPGAPAEPTANGGVKKTGDDLNFGSPVKVRDYFPETLYANPAILTDGQGKASVTLEMADSITTWRAVGLASSKTGLLGSATQGIKVFQDFFTDIDFPVEITQNDAFQVPVAVYNYLQKPQTVTLTVENADWADIEGGTSKSITLEPGDVKSIPFTVKAKTVGFHLLQVKATGLMIADAVARGVWVKPDGKEFPWQASARFASDPNPLNKTTQTIKQTFSVPKNNIDGSQKMLVKVYPGFAASAVEGMDSILRLPGGCFEQTTSSAWPNVLVTDYIKKSGKTTPEIEIKAKQYISSGYQRLLTFQTAGGGFNWWETDTEGNAVLTAVAIMMFNDTSKVGFVDPAVSVRAAKWLVERQQSDGSWTEETHLHAGNENLGAGSLRVTAYIAWALKAAGLETGAAQKALAHVKSKIGQEKDLYTIAIAAQALAVADPTDPTITALLTRLHDARKEDAEKKWTYWGAESKTMVGSYGNNSNIETTALVALAMMTAGSYSSDVGGAINYLAGNKDAQGNWGYNTQATVLALKVLVGSLSAGPSDTDADVTVKVNGEEITKKHFDTFSSDVLWQLELDAQKLKEGDNALEIEYSGKGNLMWQMTGSHWLPWTDIAPEKTGALSIDLVYDKTELSTDDTIKVMVTVTNSDKSNTGMVMVDLGLPPGFALDTSGIEAAKAKGLVHKWEKTNTQLLVYVTSVKAETPVVFTYDLIAQYPLNASAPKSQTYFYYNTTEKAEAGPVGLKVY